MSDAGSDSSSSSDQAFDMNALIRGYVREGDNADADAQAGEREETESVGGRSDGGAGQDRGQPGTRDMNAWLRDAVQESGGGLA